MQIQWTHCESLSERQREAVELRIRALAEERDDLLDVRIVARLTNHHRLGGREVRITSLVRGREIVASVERPELGLALCEALDDFEREVRRRRERRRTHRMVAQRRARDAEDRAALSALGGGSPL